jgi:hypothetical protein
MDKAEVVSEQAAKNGPVGESRKNPMKNVLLIIGPINEESR